MGQRDSRRSWCCPQHGNCSPGHQACKYLCDRARPCGKNLDFGLAKRVLVRADGNFPAMPTVSQAEPLTQPGTVMGTGAYMSPEQVRGEEMDAGTDLISFGVVLYEMATGIVPFRGETLGVVAEAILNRTPVAPVRLIPTFPDARIDY